jgi:dolichol-phosphate mannosyltransferase
MMRTLVVIPTYNEAETITTLLEAVRAAAPAVDVLVVDDGSPDGTGKLAEDVATRLGQIEVLHRPAKGGLGTAYRAGFAHGLAKGYGVLVEMDADFSHDPTALPALLRAAEEYDVVIGSRYVPGAAIPNWTLARLALSRAGNLYASLLLSLRVADSTAGFRVYRASSLERMDYSTVRAEGYAFQIEMTYRARSSGASIKEVPITFIDRAQGSYKMSSAIVVEALLLVTVWAIERPLRALRALRSRSEDAKH